LPEREQIRIFDTTLGDGEQSPGCSMSADEKLRRARQLDRLYVDVIEAGFPISSEGDFNSAVQLVARDVRRPVIAALARCCPADIERAWQALKSAAHPRIHTFLATSHIHLHHKLKLSRRECLEQARAAVRFAKSLCEDVEFSPEDATRSGPDFLCDVLRATIEAGATTSQHSRYSGIRGTVRVRRSDSDNPAASTGYRADNHFGALPQRPGSCRGKLSRCSQKSDPDLERIAHANDLMEWTWIRRLCRPNQSASGVQQVEYESPSWGLETSNGGNQAVMVLREAFPFDQFPPYLQRDRDAIFGLDFRGIRCETWELRKSYPPTSLFFDIEINLCCGAVSGYLLTVQFHF